MMIVVIQTTQRTQEKSSEERLSKPFEWLAEDIRKALETKLDKIIARELFTKYKRSPSGEEREAARKAYLDHKGILKDWRTDEEYHAPEPPDDWQG